MSEAITVPIRFDARLFWQASAGILQMKGRQGWVGFVASVLVGMLLAVGLQSTTFPSNSIVGAVAGFLSVGLLLIAQRWISRRRLEAVLRGWSERRRPSEAVFSQGGILWSGSDCEARVGWPGVDLIQALRSGTAIWYSGNCLLVSDADLRPDVTPEVFHARLAGWSGR